MEISLLVNPSAGSGAAPSAARRAAELLAHDGAHVTTLSAASAEDSTRMLRRSCAEGTDAVVVCGGDGTVGLAVQELAGTGIPLGIIPVGTGNDTAVALGLPARDIDAATAVIAGGATRAIDVGVVHRADGTARRFTTVLAAGFDARVNDRANAMRWPRGDARYTVAILAELIALRTVAYDIELELASGARHRVAEELLMAAVANGTTYGGGIRICPRARLDDGLLDVVLVRPVGRARFLRLLPRVYAGTHLTLPEVQVHRVRSARLTAAGVTGYADGDAVGALPLEVTVDPGALTVFAPAGGPAVG